MTSQTIIYQIFTLNTFKVDANVSHIPEHMKCSWNSTALFEKYGGAATYTCPTIRSPRRLDNVMASLLSHGDEQSKLRYIIQMHSVKFVRVYKVVNKWSFHISSRAVPLVDLFLKPVFIVCEFVHNRVRTNEQPLTGKHSVTNKLLIRLALQYFYIYGRPCAAPVGRVRMPPPPGTNKRMIKYKINPDL